MDRHDFYEYYYMLDFNFNLILNVSFKLANFDLVRPNGFLLVPVNKSMYLVLLSKLLNMFRFVYDSGHRCH